MISQAVVLLMDEEATRRLKRDERIQALGREIPQMQEIVAAQTIDSLNASMGIFMGNLQQLLAGLRFLTQDPQSFFLVDEGNRRRLETVLHDIARLLHNYITAGASAMEHVEKRYGDLDVQKRAMFPGVWSKLTTEFRDDPLAQFVEGLRDYLLHYAVVVPAYQLRYDARTEGAEPATNRLTLLPVSVLQRMKWNKHARRYMENKEAIDLLEVVIAYSQKVASFYDWFRAGLYEVYADDLRRLNEKKREQALLWAETIVEDCIYRSLPLSFFHSLLSAEQWQAVAVVGSDPTKRANRLLAVYGKGVGLPSTLKRMIMDLCQRADFYLPPENIANVENRAYRVVLGPESSHDRALTQFVMFY